MTKQKGFTLIEVITVVGIMAIAFPTFFAVVLGVLRQQARIFSLQQAKSQGDQLLSTIDNLVRNNAVSIHNASTPLDETTQECFDLGDSSYPTSPPENGSTFYFKDQFGNSFRIYQSGDKVASDSSIFAADEDSTAAPIVISNFTITCEVKADFSSPIVSISYDVGNNLSSTRQEEIVNLSYQTKIKLRAVQ